MRKSKFWLALATVWTLLCGLILTFPAHAITYGSGQYGRCQYGACTISLTSSATLSVDVLPASGSTTCSVSSDNVTVTTSSSDGYTLQLSDADTSAQLTASGGVVNPVAGTRASPQTLSANTWGYRVDGAGGFGAGPTTGSNNAGVPSFPFAAVPLSSDTADTIATNPVAATTGATTTVWYGVCVSTATPSGAYSDSVVYTAIIN